MNLYVLSLTLLCSVLCAQDGVRPRPNFLPLDGAIAGGVSSLVDTMREAKLVIDGGVVEIRSARVAEATEGRFTNLKALVVNSDAVVRPNGGLELQPDLRRADAFAIVVALPAEGTATEVAKKDVADLLGGRLNPVGYAVVTVDAVEGKDSVRSYIVGVRSLKAGGSEGESPSLIAQCLALDMARAIISPANSPSPPPPSPK